MNKEQYGYNADDRESASVAHIYGQNIAAAESMTAMAAPWAWSPETLKPTADKELAEGINRFVIHTSVHQPLIGKAPGLGLGPFGQWFTRNETWAEEAAPWVTYLARSSYLLQQGHFGADILYFYGEDSNVTAIFADKSPDVPAGYGFDYVNADALIHKFAVKDGNITTESGMSYRVLALDPYSIHMSLPVLRSIRALVNQGAVVVGPKPVNTPSLADNAEISAHRGRALGDGTGEHSVGKGKVYAGQTLADALAALKMSRTSTTLSRKVTPTSCSYIAGCPTATSIMSTIVTIAMSRSMRIFGLRAKLRNYGMPIPGRRGCLIQHFWWAYHRAASS